MAQRKTLTEQQVSVLRWIAEGCPDDVMDGGSHRVSAAALRNRGLVMIRGRGATWVAKITDAGCDYLSRVDGPEPPVPREANVSVTQQLVDDVVAAGGVLRVPLRGWYASDGVCQGPTRIPTGGQIIPHAHRTTGLGLRRFLTERSA
jgi:hypothetical protein